MAEVVSHICANTPQRKAMQKAYRCRHVINQQESISVLIQGSGKGLKNQDD